jgi:tetratricopeptide (TPR) repeat protein
MPYGAARTALVEQVVQHADAGSYDDLRFAARMMATTAYTYGGEPAKAFVTFSWCLRAYDRDPGTRDRDDERLLLWHFKYMVNALPSFPEVPLGRTYSVIEDMERRYRSGGHSLHAVYRQRWGVAHHIGDAVAANAWYERWCAAPRDENSDCAGCDPGAKVAHLAACGRDEEAVALAEPLLNRQLTCTEQPQSILTELLLPYLRTGRLAEAADAHRRAYRLMRGNLADLASIAEHVMFCVRTGNEPRGLEIVERHLGWLDRSPSPWATMRFAAAAARLLDRLAAGGHADMTVRRPVPGKRGAMDDGPAGDGGAASGRGAAASRGAAAGRTAADVPLPELAAQLAAQARELGARFDARNGTTHQGAAVAAWLAAEPVVGHLPLSAVDQRRRTLVAPPPSPSPRPSEPGSARPPAGDGGTAWPDDPAELLDLGERLFREHRTRRARAAWARFDERHPADTLTPLLAARRVDASGLLATSDDRHEEAERCWREAADGYGLAGDEVRRQVTRSRLGTLLCGTDRYEQGLPMVEEATAYIVANGGPERRAGAELRLAHALGLGQRPMAALEAVERAMAHADDMPDADPLLDAEVAMRRAQYLLTLGRTEEAAGSAGLARERFAAAGDPPAAALAYLLYAHALTDLADHAGAAAAFGAALERSTEPDVVLSAQLGRGRAHLAGGEPGAAVEPLVEAVAGFVAEGNDSAATFARFDLAAAYHAAGQPLDAAEAAEEALPELERLGARDAADRCRYLLSLVYRALDQPDEALSLLDQLVTNLDGFDNLPGRSQMHEEAGHILYQQDRDATAARRFGAAADGYRDAGLTLDEVRSRRWMALALRWADEIDEAIVTLATAEESAQRLPADDASTTWERAMLAFDGARVLIGAGQIDDALRRAVVSGDGFRSIGAFSEALQADLLHAELLLRLERPEDAEPVLRGVLGTAPRDSPARENGAWLLSEVLEALGRSDDAAAVRKEYGLTDD